MPCIDIAWKQKQIILLSTAPRPLEIGATWRIDRCVKPRWKTLIWLQVMRFVFYAKAIKIKCSCEQQLLNLQSQGLVLFRFNGWESNIIMLSVEIGEQNMTIITCTTNHMWRVSAHMIFHLSLLIYLFAMKSCAWVNHSPTSSACIHFVHNIIILVRHMVSCINYTCNLNINYTFSWSIYSKLTW